ncbi:hypothetical protein TNCV_3111561 [Trichonephila clavipes]|nr:hypothetical protein TNCV_3111561 [Trichonephila clavipes]
MPGPNGHVHTFHNEMTPRPVETTCGVEQVELTFAQSRRDPRLQEKPGNHTHADLASSRTAPPIAFRPCFPM